MPQLDKFTFSSQVIWLVLVFFFLYFVLVQIGLPRLHKILHFRKKKLLDLNKGSIDFVSELYFFSTSFDKFSALFLNKAKNFSEIFFIIPQEELEVSSKLKRSLMEKANKSSSSSYHLESVKDAMDSSYFLRNKFNSTKKV